MRKLDAAQWSEYWQKGTITTFHKHFEDNYDGEIRDFWFGVFSALSAGANVLDLATGNGALVQLLLDYSQQQELALNIDAVDFADIRPALTQSPHASVTIHANTDIRDTGLAASATDLVISQYGLEYADLPAAFEEIKRLVKPHATLALIVHTDDSRIIQQGLNTLEQHDFISRKVNIMSTVKELLQRLEKLRKRGQIHFDLDPKAEKLRAKLNRKMQAMMDFSDTQKDPGFLTYIIENITAVFQSANARSMTTGKKLAVLRQVEIESRAHRERMEDLLAAALSPQDMGVLRELISDLGFEIINDEDLFYKDSLVGRKLLARR